MAWNGSNGRTRASPAICPYTSWRKTPAEDAMRDFLVAHAELPRGARLWTFGTPRARPTTAGRRSRGTLSAGRATWPSIPIAACDELVSPATR